VFHAHFARGGVFDDVRFHGMTDRAIVRGGLERLGLPCGEAAIDAVCATYLAALADEMPRAHDFRVHPGVREVLDALAGRPHVTIGIGTGNLREGARLELEHARLAHHFAFGGYGCDHELRPEIVRIAAERGAARLGMPVAACRVVVIGDTPRDVEAARAIGAEALTVETGGVGSAELRAAGATWAVRDLAAAGVVDVLAGAQAADQR
jgi:phosphoglycolate phosphatase